MWCTHITVSIREGPKWIPGALEHLGWRKDSREADNSARSPGNGHQGCMEESGHLVWHQLVTQGWGLSSAFLTLLLAFSLLINMSWG